MIRIESAKEADLPGIISLEKLAFPDPWSEEGLAKELKLVQAHYFVAKFAGSVIGYAGFWHLFNEAEIMKVCVMPEYRRRGVAHSLLSTLYKTAKKLGANTMLLEVRKSNTPARALYEKEGFTEYGVREKYYQKTEDAILYRRSL